MDDYNQNAKQPKALNCGHTFCAQCIQDITDARNRVGLLWLFERHNLMIVNQNKATTYVCMLCNFAG